MTVRDLISQLSTFDPSASVEFARPSSSPSEWYDDAAIFTAENLRGSTVVLIELA